MGREPRAIVPRGRLSPIEGGAAAAIAITIDVPGRGLVRVTRDALGYDTSIEYAEFEFLPASVTDPAGLTTRFSHDYRLFQPAEVIDRNGNVVTRSPHN